MNLDTKSIVTTDGEAELHRSFLEADEAGRLFAILERTLAWNEEWITLGAKKVKVPRLVCWYGASGAAYSYSGVRHDPLPWTAELAALKARVETAAAHVFNSALGNYYRDGSDSMGWHADREPELGLTPYIASLSLGDERLFKLRHVKSGATVDIPLTTGSLLLMRGPLQHHWRHCVPKTRRPVGPRINLTFRLIQT